MNRNIVLPYNPKLKARARELRKNQTETEQIIWAKLRNKQLGFEFHRQVPIDNFIVDFYCHELMLAIEIDGDSHFTDGAPERDMERTQILNSFGVTVLRYTNIDVKQNLYRVLDDIMGWIENHG